MHRLVIDTDPGVDDAHAILLAFAHPNARVEALTTVAGNVSLERTTANALAILDVLGASVPVYPGCANALVQPTTRRATSHGVDGLGDSHLPPSLRRPEAERAAQALVRLANQAPSELTLVALGPLSNIALATRLDPDLPKKYKRLVVLGGAVHAKGNSWNTAAEFNFYIDPEAAAVVFEQWPGLTFIPWETAMQYGLTARLYAELIAIDTPKAAFFRRIFGERAVKQIEGRGVCYDPDPLAIAVAMEPDIVRQAESRYVQIELAGQLTRGQTVVDWDGLYNRPANATFVLEIDRERFEDLLRLSLKGKDLATDSH